DKETKTSGSTRSIKLASIAFNMLRLHKNWQVEERNSMGDQWHDNDRVFSTYNGEPINPDTVTQSFESFVKKHNLPKVSIHSLRHTNATLLIASGTDLRTVSHRLGHTQTSTT